MSQRPLHQTVCDRRLAPGSGSISSVRAFAAVVLDHELRYYMMSLGNFVLMLNALYIWRRPADGPGQDPAPPQRAL